MNCQIKTVKPINFVWLQQMCSITTFVCSGVANMSLKIEMTTLVCYTQYLNNSACIRIQKLKGFVVYLLSNLL